MGKIKKVYIVSHTHWDREWYLTRESFRVMLVDLIDRLLDILDSDSRYNAFMLDGQAIVIEDYIEIRPENEEKLRNYIKQGRILIGPWYVLPDELLISGEAHIRNYIVGNEVCNKFGSKMNLGYLPDAFGHPSQMPQIIKGLGMNEMIFWRGVGPEIKNTDFIWEGPDGSNIIAVNMPFGYGTAACLPDEMEHFARRIKKEVERLSKVTAGDTILLMNGVDHIAPESYLPDMLEATKNEFDYEIVHTVLPEYVKHVKESGVELEHFKGELRSPKKAYLLGGTLSTRMYLKQKNFNTEQLIEKYAEPLSLIAYNMGFKYPKGELNKLWKYALSNLPHDSICGCSVDEVHREMMVRYGFIEELGMGLLNKMGRYIAANAKADANHDGAFIVLNTNGQKRDDIVNVTVDIDPRLIRNVDFDNYQILDEHDTGIRTILPKSVALYDRNGIKIPCCLNSVEKKITMKLSLDNQPEMYDVLKLHLSFIAKDVPSVGFTEYYFDVEYEDKNNKNEIKPFIENEYFKVSASIDGSLEIFDKTNNKIYSECGKLVDSGDAGDEYTYSPPLCDTSIMPLANSIKVEVAEKNEVKETLKICGIMQLPVSVTDDRKNRNSKTIGCWFRNLINIYPGIRRIDVKCEFENNAKDHILKVVFPTGIDTKCSYAENVFSVDCRPALDVNDRTDYSSWVEAPSGTSPQKTFVDVNDGKIGFAIANKGIPEFNVSYDKGQSVISLTLLRCVGWLSRKDLILRKGNGGWTLETKDAQCPGKYTFEYSIIPHSGDFTKGEIVRISHDFASPCFAFQVDGKSCGELDSYSLVEVESPAIALTCAKLTEDNKGYAVRLVNESGSNINTMLKAGFNVNDAYFASLDERPYKKADIKDNNILIAFKPWEIVTLILYKK